MPSTLWRKGKRKGEEKNEVRRDERRDGGRREGGRKREKRRGESPASNAVDADVNTTSCTTDYSGRPWWAVDLGQRYYIGHVTITLPNAVGGYSNYHRSCFIHTFVNSISGLW